jgi:hypothetical protein
VRELADRIAEVSELARARMDRLGEFDAASQDVLIEVVRTLEEQQWMLRVQLGGETDGGLPWLSGSASAWCRRGPRPPGAVRHRRFPRALRRADTAHSAPGLELHDPRRS